MKHIEKVKDVIELINHVNKINEHLDVVNLPDKVEITVDEAVTIVVLLDLLKDMLENTKVTVFKTRKEI